MSLVNITRDFKAMNEATDWLSLRWAAEAYATFWTKEPPARVAVQVAALAGNATAPRLWI